jgi:hypothetical protein
MKTVLKCILLLFGLLFLNCSIINSRFKHYVTVDSKLSSTKVYVGRKENTYIKKYLVRSCDYSLVIKLKGFKVYELKLEEKFNTWCSGNVVYGDFIVLKIDRISGAIYKVRPKECRDEFKNDTIYDTVDGILLVQICKNIDPEYEMIGHLERSE